MMPASGVMITRNFNRIIKNSGALFRDLIPLSVTTRQENQLEN